MFEHAFKISTMGAHAEFERSLIVKRTQAGILSGRRFLSLQIDHARALIEGGASPCAVARAMRIGKSTLYRALKGSERATGVARTTV